MAYRFEKEIPTWDQRVANLDRPTDFAKGEAAMREARDLRFHAMQLEASLATLQQQLAAAREELLAASDLLAHRFEQLQVAEADAARYRWLAEKPGFIRPHLKGQPVYVNWSGSREDLDAAIDATLQRDRQP